MEFIGKRQPLTSAGLGNALATIGLEPAEPAVIWAVVEVETSGITQGCGFRLDGRPQILFERTRHDRNRPLLQVENPRQRIEELHRQRDPLYREVAHIIVEGGRGNPGTMVRLIEGAVHKHEANTCRP